MVSNLALLSRYIFFLVKFQSNNRFARHLLRFF